MKTKQTESSAKNATGVSAKDVLPPGALGKQREPVAVKRPGVESSEERADLKACVTYIERHFAEWSPACEVVGESGREEHKGFREDNYEYMGLGADRPCVWKPASQFFSILKMLEASNRATVFQPFTDDFLMVERRKRFDGLCDDSSVNYASRKTAEASQPTICAFEEEEESDAAFATRVSEFDRDFKPRPGQKKPVLVS